MRRKGATIAIIIGAAVLALAGIGAQRNPTTTTRPAQSFYCECVTIECQVCPALDWFGNADKVWCEDRGYRYAWNSTTKRWAL